MRRARSAISPVSTSLASTTPVIRPSGVRIACATRSSCAPRSPGTGSNSSLPLSHRTGRQAIAAGARDAPAGTPGSATSRTDCAPAPAATR